MRSIDNMQGLYPSDNVQGYTMLDQHQFRRFDQELQRG